MSINLETIKPLPKKKIIYSDWYKEKHGDKIPVHKRVLFLNPKKIYKKIEHKIDIYKRHQSIQVDDLFPKVEGKCACGCKKLPANGENKDGSKWQRKWATESCREFANDIVSIINNYWKVAQKYISIYYGEKCSECPETNMLELDHIIGVKHGGGACWLSNYRWVCKTCHNKKTNKDFKKGEFKNTNQLKLIS